MTCRDLDATLDAYVDDALPPRAQRAASIHLAYCGGCRRYLLAYVDTIELARGEGDADAPPLPEPFARSLVATLTAAATH